MNTIRNIISDTWDNYLVRVSILIGGGGWIVCMLMSALASIVHKSVS
jgi:hypothetical protein